MLNGIPVRAGAFVIQVRYNDQGLGRQDIFWTTVTLLATRPPMAEQPPAAASLVSDPPPAAETPVIPAGEVIPHTGAQLAATGLRSETLNTVVSASIGALFLGATLVTAAGRRPRERSKPQPNTEWEA